GGQRFHAADRLEPDVVAAKVGDFAGQINPHEPPQHLDFGDGALPVFGGKGVKRKGADAEMGAVFDDRTDSVDASPMPGKARKSAAFGPSTVAIHDDGNVRWHTRGVDGKR